ncbi:MAG TPA: lysylphosphatidylglycerol synthase domain-containing protein [Solirubrobacteraceae bacterium]|nr:lysylphosphatidylglycerol synthase domain-containing protein [Solirubrobacteraceae bacterium]
MSVEQEQDRRRSAHSGGEMPDELSPKHLARRLIALLVLAAVVAVAISALPGLGTLRQRFSDADVTFIVLAGLCKLASSLSNIVAFRDVICPRLGWLFSYRLGMAEQAANVLLPTGGAGGLALGAWALHRGGMPTDHIARRSVAFFVITSAPNFLCVLILGPLLATHVLSGHAPLWPTVALTALAVGSIAVAVALPFVLGRIRPRRDDTGLRHKVRTALASLADGIRDAGALLWPGRWRVIAGSIGFLGFDILAFACAFAACGATPPVGPLVFGYVVGQLGGLIPLPGGVGGTDGGLIGAMVLYGAPLSNAAAAVVIYRTFQLGIPAILGAIAFVQLRRTLRDSSKSAEIWGGLAEQ